MRIQKKRVKDISQWIYITILVVAISMLFFLVSYVKTIVINYKIMEMKEIKNNLVVFYLILGPWATESLYVKPDKPLSVEEEIKNFYEVDLKKKIKSIRGAKRIDLIVEVLISKKFSVHERNILRSYIESDEVEDSNFLNVMSILVSMAVAVFIGLIASQLSGASNMILLFTMILSLVLLFMYAILLFTYSNLRSKAKMIRIALNRYEKTYE